MNPPLESDLLRTFVAVAENGNFTRAGVAVGRTQSAVSMQIKRLEDILGETLFERGSRGVNMTGNGVRLLDNARRIVAMLDDTAAAIRTPVLDGAVRIGISEEYINSKLPKALGTFAAIHPKVEVTVRQGSSFSNNDALNAGELDIAVVFEAGGRTKNELLMVDPTVWVTSDQHRIHERSPLPIATYTPKKGGWCDDKGLQALAKRGVKSRVAYISRTSSGFVAAVTSGLAVAPMSRSSIPLGCRELTLADGFDVIDFSNVVMRLRSRTPDSIVYAMSNAIREAFQA